ncbi:hypothetical protein Misp04_35800 [Micromonospora sp. NBRC 101691]|nr:hypothetical protein Misp04_35800 [Micromonospora sp. NBRC 101691]
MRPMFVRPMFVRLLFLRLLFVRPLFVRHSVCARRQLALPAGVHFRRREAEDSLPTGLCSPACARPGAGRCPDRTTGTGGATVGAAHGAVVVREVPDPLPRLCGQLQRTWCATSPPPPRQPTRLRAEAAHAAPRAEAARGSP